MVYKVIQMLSLKLTLDLSNYLHSELVTGVNQLNTGIKSIQVAFHNWIQVSNQFSVGVNAYTEVDVKELSNTEQVNYQ